MFKFLWNLITAPALGALAVTPNDSTDLTEVCRGFSLGVGGNVKVTMYDKTVVTITGLVGGVVHPIAVRRIWSTGTTATSITAYY